MAFFITNPLRERRVQMKYKTLRIATLAMALALVAGGGSIYVANRHDARPDAATDSARMAPQTAKLTISDAGKTVAYEGQTGRTALAVLQSLADVTTKQSSYGEFVTGINDVQADGDTKYWAFYVNGKLADEGAGTFKTADGQKIEWRVEAVQQ